MPEENVSDSDQPERYFFVHMQKTAGITLCRRMMNHFGRAAVYPMHGVDGDDGITPYISIRHLRERLAARGDEIQVVTGHFPLCTTEIVGGRWTTLTLLREPVARTLSYLRYRRKRAPEVRGMSLEEIYERPLDFNSFLHNHMTKMLSLKPDELTLEMLTPVEFTHDHLERAKNAVAGIDAVGFQEHFEDFCGELTARFGWRLGDPEVANRTAPTDPNEVSESFHARPAEEDPRFVDAIPDRPLEIARYEPDYALELVRDTGWEVLELHPPERFIQHHMICRPV